MVQINFALKEVNCKIVYYGPGMSGKTTNLEVVHQKAPESNKGELTSIATEGDRTLLAGPGFQVPVTGIEGLEAGGRLPRKLAFGLRPEAVRVAPVESEETPFQGEVVWVEHLGSKMILDLRFAEQIVRAVVPPEHAVAEEGRAWLGFTPQAEHLVDQERALFFR